jgi:hypothetical protein
MTTPTLVHVFGTLDMSNPFPRMNRFFPLASRNTASPTFGLLVVSTLHPSYTVMSRSAMYDTSEYPEEWVAAS